MFVPPSSTMAALDLQTRVMLSYDVVFTLFVGGLGVFLVAYLVARRHVGS